jgi:recombination protein RecA
MMTTKTDPSKENALAKAMQAITKRYGDGAVMMFGDAPKGPIPVISTGSIAIDIATGVGGFPRGRFVEVMGPESSGKSTLCLHLVAEAQKAGGNAAYIDMEHALDPKYASAVGVDIEKMVLSQPGSAEEALEIAEALIRSGAMDIVIIDSVAALVPMKELEGDMGDAMMGLQARLMGQALRKLTPTVHQTNTLVVFVNQIRQKLGIIFGSNETTTGGNALKFYSTMRVDVRRTGTNKSGVTAVSNSTRVKIIKNKVASPFKVAEVVIEFGVGFNHWMELVDLGSKVGVIDKRGSFFSFEETRLGQGAANSAAFLKENPDLAARIEKLIKEAIATGVFTPEVEHEESDS